MPVKKNTKSAAKSTSTTASSTSKKGKKAKATKPAPQLFDKRLLSKIGKDLLDYKNLVVDEKRKAKDKFMDLYQQCEYAYKELLKDYKVKVEHLIPNTTLKKRSATEFNPENLQVREDQYTKILVFAGITADRRLFSSSDPYDDEGTRSCRKLRDRITHGSSKKAVNEVFNRREELYAVMEAFLDQFK